LKVRNCSIINIKQHKNQGKLCYNAGKFKNLARFYADR